MRPSCSKGPSRQGPGLCKDLKEFRERTKGARADVSWRTLAKKGRSQPSACPLSGLLLGVGTAGRELMLDGLLTLSNLSGHQWGLSRESPAQ